MTETTDKVPGSGKTDNGQVDAAKEATKLLVAKMKAIGLDSRGLYTAWNNGALNSDGANDAVDTIDFMVMKKKLTADDKAAILTMFEAMAKANAPKVKPVKVIPDGIEEDFAQAWFVRQQVMAEYNAAKLAVEKLWTPAIDASKLELDAARAAVHDAGFGTDMKTGLVKTTKSASTTDGTHGNSGKTKLSIGWVDINIGGKEYDSWVNAVKALEPSMVSSNPTNYLANTDFANKCAAKGLPISVTVKLSLKDHTIGEAVEAWNKLDDTGKLASGAHRKLAEVGATINFAH